jgi:osmotically-inducible protein OsmY
MEDHGAPQGRNQRTLMAHASVKDVQPRAQRALASSPIFELRELQVEQQKGNLLLSGIVSSFYYKQLAQEVVRAVCKECDEQELDLINAIHVR